MESFLPIDMLATFLEIADKGSFSHAAKVINRTQSTVSMQIKRLEEIVGKPLITRDNKLSTLTPDGEILAAYAKKMVKTNNEALSQLCRPEYSGIIKIGLPDDYVERFLPEILAGFSRANPNVQVEVSVRPSYILVDQLEKGELDLAITTTSEPAYRNSVLLFRESAVWVSSERHSAHEISPLPLAIFPNSNCFFRIWATRELERAGIDYRIAFTSESIMGITVAVSAGLAVSVMNRSIVPKGLRIIDERQGFPPLPEVHIHLHINQDSKNPAIESLQEHIIRSFNI